MIHVVIPHYKALHWLVPCVDVLCCRANVDDLEVTVVTMEDNREQVEEVRQQTSHWPVTVFNMPTLGQVGGQPLPAALERGVRSNLNADITLLVDPDALVLVDGWDIRLIEIFSDPDVIAAGINPRSNTSAFAGVPEWNWLAFRTDFWRDHIGTFQWNRHDIGHLFADAAAKHGKKVYLWPLVRKPYPSRGCSIVGDTVHPEFVMHAFYSTRRRDDTIPENERSEMLAEDQEKEMIAYATKGLR